MPWPGSVSLRTATQDGSSNAAAVWRSCSAAIIVYQGSPLAATVIPNGPLPLTALPSVMTPALVILATLPLVSWVNHTLPSGEAAMPEGPVLRHGEERHRVGGRVEAPDSLGREPGGEPDLPIGGDGDARAGPPWWNRRWSGSS